MIWIVDKLAKLPHSHPSVPSTLSTFDEDAPRPGKGALNYYVGNLSQVPNQARLVGSFPRPTPIALVMARVGAGRTASVGGMAPEIHLRTPGRHALLKP